MPRKSAVLETGESDTAPRLEDLLKQIERLINDLEKGDELSLEDSVAAYEEGLQLIEKVQERLENAEQRIEILSANAGEGKAADEP